MSSLQVGVTLAWRVAEVAGDGTATIEQTLSKLTVALDLPGGDPVRYDSSAPVPPNGNAQAVADEFRPLLGKTVAVRLTPRGELQDAAAPVRKRGADSVLSPTDVRQILGRLLPPLPPANASSAAGWKDSQSHITPQGKIRIDGEYISGGREPPPSGPMEKIVATYQYHAAANERGVTLSVTDQDNSGAFYFDVQAGRLVRGEVNQSLTMQVTVEGNQAAQKVVSQMHIDFQPQK